MPLKDFFKKSTDYENRIHGKIHDVINSDKHPVVRFFLNASCFLSEKLKRSKNNDVDKSFNDVVDSEDKISVLNNSDPIHDNFEQLGGHPVNKLHNCGKICTIYATYSSDGKIPEKVLYALRNLSEVSDYIIVVGDYNLSDDFELEKIKNLANCACYVRHCQYDFGSWAKGYFHLKSKGILSEFDNLIFMNDSNYGPVVPLNTMYEEMFSRSCDFWGVTDNDDGKNHLMSYFLAFRKNVFCSKVFENYFSSIPSSLSFEEAAFVYESNLTEALSKEFSYDMYVPHMCRNNRGIVAGNGNPTIWPVSLIELGSPFLKAKVINGTFGRDLRESKIDVLSCIEHKNKELYHIVMSDFNIKYDLKRYDATSECCNPSNICALLKSVDVVSFDIFDTLLVRPFPSPQHLFNYMEEAYKIPRFRIMREEAEKKARSEIEKEATYDEIHSFIPDGNCDLSAIELDLESRFLMRNELVYPLYEQAVKMGKKIICVSDMYLDDKFIRHVLENVGYTNISDIFVSSRWHVGKGDGLFKVVIEKTGVDPSKMLHIGDNKQSDYESPINYGMNALCINKYIDLLLGSNSNTKFADFITENNTLSASIYLSMVALYRTRCLDTSPLYDFGYCYGGPLVLSYLDYVARTARAHNIDLLLFSARDCYILNKIYKKYFGSNVRCEYAYLTRSVGMNSLLEYSGNPTYLEKLLKEASLSDDSIRVSSSYLENKKCFEDHYDKLLKKSEHLRNNLMLYLEKLAGTSKRIAVVDMTTTAMTSYRIAKDILKDRVVLSIGTCSFGRDVNIPSCTFLDRILTESDLLKIEISEELVTSPESTIIGIDENLDPIFGNTPGREYVNDILNGIESYCDRFMEIFGTTDVGCMPMKEWFSLIDSYVKYANEADLRCIDSIVHSADPDGVSDVCSISSKIKNLQKQQ